MMRLIVDDLDKFVAASRSGRLKTEDVTQLVEESNRALSLAVLEDVDFELVPEPKGVRLEIVLKKLLDVIHYQFAAAMADLKEYRHCRHCGKPFELTPQINRCDRQFCSDTCRVKAYQERKRQAVALRLRGHTLREICKGTGSDMATVKKWVANVAWKKNQA
jgi:hypothetical protein